MAWCSLCICFLVTLLRISSILSHNDNFFYTTDSDHISEHHIELRSLGNDHLQILQKKQTLDQLPAMVLSSTTETNSTAEETPPKKKPTKLQKVFSPTTTQPIGVKGPAVNNKIGNTVPTSFNHTIYLTKDKNGGNDSKLFRGANDEDQYVDADSDKDYDQMAAKHNVTVKTDTHMYYNSSFLRDSKVAQHYWVNLTGRTGVKVDDLLSNSHRRATTVKLSFEFPFYGHIIQNVTIATGGFLYTGDYVHSWLAATQYIAPLMANFDTSISNTSFIKYVDNGTAITVEWHKVNLQEKPNDGQFTFQATLHKNGDIVFVYKDVPFTVRSIGDVNHPVRVGLSDAYIMDHTVFFVRRKTIYEYHHVDFTNEDIANWTVVYMTPLSTCLDSTDCVSCLVRPISFECMWCPSLNKCSTGFDRNRQEWLAQNCNGRKIENETMCSLNGTDDDDNQAYFFNSRGDSSPTQSRVYISSTSKQPEQLGVSGIVAIIFLLAMTAGLAVWVFYAYKNPHTTSGQILIRYRPSQWRWRRGEAKYTAATIHM